METAWNDGIPDVEQARTDGQEYFLCFHTHDLAFLILFEPTSRNQSVVHCSVQLHNLSLNISLSMCCSLYSACTQFSYSSSQRQLTSWLYSLMQCIMSRLQEVVDLELRFRFIFITMYSKTSA